MTTKQPQSRSTGDQKKQGQGSGQGQGGHQRSGSRNYRRSTNNNGNGGLPTEVFTSQEFQANSQDRLLYLFIHSIGCDAEIQVNSGDKINGIIESIDPKTLQIFLKNANDGLITRVNFNDLIDFEIMNVDLFNTDHSARATPTGSFKTDVETSRASGTQGRAEIEKWVPENTNGLSLGSLTLEGGSSSNWDQFQTNEQKFGIKSEFDENLYTTKINKNDPNYLKNLETANKLAKEIEGQSFNGSVHLAEERGLKFDDSGIDEEDKYSSVDRSQENTTGTPATQSKGDALFESLINKRISTNFKSTEKSKYVPPSQRSIVSNFDPAIVSASKASSPSNIGTPSAATSQTPTPLEAPSTKAEPSKQDSATPAQSSTSTPSTVPQKPSFASKPIVNPPTKESSNHHHRKKVNHKNELDSLKEFSQNFKIPSKFPSDLLPIVSKDKRKQEEIVKKHESDEANKSSVNSSAVTEASISSPTKLASTASTSIIETAVVPKPKEESTTIAATPAVKKFNPKATSFTPSSGTILSPAISHGSSPSFSKNSPRMSHAGFKPKRTTYSSAPSSFFSPDKLPNSNKPRGFKKNEFNFFKGCLEEHKARGGKEKFKLERPFTTPPIWTVHSTDPNFEKSYKSLFAELEESRLRQQQYQIPHQQPGAYLYQYQQYPPNFPNFPHQPQQQPVMFPPQQQPMGYQQYPAMQQRFVPPIHPGGHPGSAAGYQQQFQPPMPYIQQPGSIPPNQQPFYYQGGPPPVPMGSPPPLPPPNAGAPQQQMMGQLSPPLAPHQLHQQSPQFYQQKSPASFQPPPPPPAGAPAPLGAPSAVPAHPVQNQGRPGGYNPSGYTGGGNAQGNIGPKGKKNNR